MNESHGAEPGSGRGIGAVLAHRGFHRWAMMPKTSYSLSEDFHFAVTDSASGAIQNIKVRFRGP
jgi:hypothetical protein